MNQTVELLDVDKRWKNRAWSIYIFVPDWDANRLWWMPIARINHNIKMNYTKDYDLYIRLLGM